MRQATRKLTAALLVTIVSLALCGCQRPETAPSAKAPAAKPAPSKEAPLPLEYIELLTGGAKPGEELPMVVAVHGLGDRPENFAGVYDGLPARARIILPRAPKTWRPGYSWFDIAIPYSENEASLAAGIGEAADLLADFITQLRDRVPTIGRPVITGFSQGGMLSFAVAVRHPDLISMAIPMGGALPRDLLTKSAADANLPSVRAFHGAGDPLIPVDQSRRTVRSLVELGFDATLTEYPGVGHTIGPEMREEVFELLKGLGH